MRGYPQFSFWISITLVEIYICCIIINRGKNTFESVGAVLKLNKRKRLHKDEVYFLEDLDTKMAGSTMAAMMIVL